MLAIYFKCEGEKPTTVFFAKSHLNFTAPIFELHRKNRKENVFSPLFKWFVRFQLIKLLSCLHSVNIKSFKNIVIELKKKKQRYTKTNVKNVSFEVDLLTRK